MNKNEYIHTGIEIASFGIFSINIERDEWQMTQIVNDLFGVSDKYKWSYEGFIELIAEEKREELRLFFKNVFKSNAMDFSTRFYFRRPDNQQKKCVACKGKLLRDDEGRVVKVFGTNIDITKYVLLEEKQENQNVFLNDLLDAIDDFVFIKSYKGIDNGKYILVNKALTKVSDLSKEKMLNHYDGNFNTKEDTEMFLEEDITCMQEEKPLVFEKKMLNSKGEIIVKEVIKAPYYSEGKVAGVIGIGRDVTYLRDLELEEIRLKEQAETYAYTDHLTKVKNRNYYNINIERIRNACNNQLAMIIIIDINNFKIINDTKGHFIGDKVLESVGKALNELMKKNDLAIRYGGDEFLLFVCDVDVHIIDRYIDDLRKKVNETVANNVGLFANGIKSISLGIGFVQYENNISIDEQIGKADVKMYANKAIEKRKMMRITN